jgi:hypothetical protein
MPMKVRRRRATQVRGTFKIQLDFIGKVYNSIYIRYTNPALSLLGQENLGNGGNLNCLREGEV